MRIALRITTIAAAITSMFLATTSVQAKAAATPRASKALSWAINNAKGDPYRYGSAGPNSWDCSGLVMRAYQKAGVKYFGRSTTQMLNSGRLRKVSRSWALSHRGTLAFRGSGHVEMVSSTRYKYGARRSGTRVGFTKWDNGFTFYRVLGAS